MCNFFSFITYKGEKYYFNHLQRGELPISNYDSHTEIAHHFLGSNLKEDHCNKYEYFDGELKIDTIQDKDECFEDVKTWMDKFAKSDKFEKICIATVKENGRALQYVKDQTEDACLAAVNESGYALKFVNKEFKHLFE
jgi:hypothetical protein